MARRMRTLKLISRTRGVSRMQGRMHPQGLQWQKIPVISPPFIGAKKIINKTFVLSKAGRYIASVFKI